MARAFDRYWPIPLRIVLGVAFMVHGAPKLFSAAQHAKFEGFLGQLGVPLPQLMSWVVGVVEFFGGLALILGAFTWIAAALLAIDMIFAILLVHLRQGGVELPLSYLAGVVALFIGGPGPLSVDERTTTRPDSPLLAPWWRHRHAHV
jgi:putative oxidoreductase